MLLGTVSRKLLMQASCPVLVVKKPTTVLKRVLLGADGSIESWEAAAWLERLPEHIRPAVTVASVIPPLPLESLRVPSRLLRWETRSRECSDVRLINSRPESPAC